MLPVLNAHCLQCHGGVHQKGGIDLRTLPASLKGDKTGVAVVPDKPDDSLLWQKLAGDEMPRTDNKVSEANKRLIRDWIAAGAKGAERKAAPVATRPARKPEEVARLIDREVADRLAAAKVAASPKVDEAEFLRRAYLDVVGKPPTAQQAAAFLDSTDPDKRAKLIDALLASSDYGRHFGERWVNVFYLTTVNQRPLPPEPFKEWLARQLNEGRGWDAVTRDVLTATGPLSESPQGLFFYYNGDMNSQFAPKILAGNVAQVYLGVQLQCAECHDHPFSDWKQTDFWGLAAFFGEVARLDSVENKMTPRVKERHQEVKPGKKPPPPLKEMSVSIPNDGEACNGGKRVPDGFLDGSKVTADPTQSHRPLFAEWLTAKGNRLFARAAVIVGELVKRGDAMKTTSLAPTRSECRGRPPLRSDCLWSVAADRDDAIVSANEPPGSQ